MRCWADSTMKVTPEGTILGPHGKDRAACPLRHATRRLAVGRRAANRTSRRAASAVRREGRSFRPSCPRRRNSLDRVRMGHSAPWARTGWLTVTLASKDSRESRGEPRPRAALMLVPSPTSGTEYVGSCSAGQVSQIHWSPVFPIEAALEAMEGYRRLGLVPLGAPAQAK